MDLKIIEKPLFFLVSCQCFDEIFGSLPKAWSDQERATQSRAKPEKTNPKSLPKAVPNQERSTQDRIRPGKAYPRQGQARKGLPKAGPKPKWAPKVASDVGIPRSNQP